MLKCCVTKEKALSATETKKEPECGGKCWPSLSKTREFSLHTSLCPYQALVASGHQPSELPRRPPVLTAGNLRNLASPSTVGIIWAGHTNLNKGTLESSISL